MSSKIADEEKAQFSSRLNATLHRAGLGKLSLADFIREFNLRADGARVTNGAARKWLHGEAIPTQEKVHILARWLAVSAEWLRFGENGNEQALAKNLDTASKALLPADRLFLSDLHSLPLREQKLMRALLDTLLLNAEQA